MNPRPLDRACAWSPASVGNVGVGFDILGHSLDGAGDRAEVRRIDAPQVRIEAIEGCITDLPREARANTAGAALLALREALDLPFGFAVRLHKGIALGSGMGGSAASCVAALVAANALLDAPLSRPALYPFALEGEAVASGGRHGDNLGSMLLGGLVLATHDRLLRIAVPEAWHCALAHPHAVLETRRSRQVLAEPYPLADVVTQSAHLALFLAGCREGDVELIREGLRDVLVEPRRAPLVPGFDAVKKAALDAGALGASLSGAGPSVFAWCASREEAERAADAMVAAFATHGLDSDRFVAPVNGPAADLVPCAT